MNIKENLKEKTYRGLYTTNKTNYLTLKNIYPKTKVAKVVFKQNGGGCSDSGTGSTEKPSTGDAGSSGTCGGQSYE